MTDTDADGRSALPSTGPDRFGFVVPRRPLGRPLPDLLRERGETYSTDRILGLAARAARAVDTDDGPEVGVWASSPAFVLASVLALWRLDRRPLLLDPGLKGEPEGLARRFPGLLVLTPDRDCPLPGARLLTEGPAEPLAAVWPGENRVAALFFTSGSTGEPKLVPKWGYQLLGQLSTLLAGGERGFLGLSPGFSVFCLVPPFHILGFLYGLVLPVLGEGRAAFTSGAPHASWVTHLRDGEPDLVVGVPTHYRLLARLCGGPLPEALYLSSGGPLPPEVDRAFAERAGRRIVQMYGSTETGGIARRVGYGAWQPFPGLDWRVRPEDGRLVVRSSWQADPGRWYVTDDVAEPTSDGFRLLGRADSIVKVAGKRLSLDEVAREARGLSGVELAEAVTYERFGERAVGLVLTPAPGCDLTEDAVRRELHARLAAFKVPRTIRIVAAMPVRPTGKVDRRALARLVEGDR